MNIGLANNVREMMLHILAVELRYADRLNEMEVTPYEAHSTVRVGELFAIGAKVHALFSNYLSRTSDKNLGVCIRVSYAHVRYPAFKRTEDVRPRIAARRASLGTACDPVAGARLRDRWPQDFIFSDLMA